ncbi:lamin-1-like [Mercenaria mercenaria]|uniref:lamin-1-like n=1 Tax=Mercenaria mercenaria TaxID=6596 RepID=UPI00234E6C34|nr:lamin-1-like [Mercenaria mercenaria]
MPPDGYTDATNAAGTDFNGIISVIMNYEAFQSKIHDDLSKKYNIFEQGRDVSKVVRHCPKLELEDTDLQQCFSVLQSLLSDPAYLSANTDAQNAKTKLLQLQNDTLVIGKDDIRKVLDDIAKAVQDKIKTEMNEYMKEAEKKKLELINVTNKSVKAIGNQGKISIAELDNALKSAIDVIEKQTKESLKKVQAEADKGVNKLEVKAEAGEKQIEESTDKGVNKLEVKAEVGEKQIEESTDKGVNKLEVEAEAGVKQIEESTDKRVYKLEAKAEAGEKQIEESIDKGVNKLEVEAEAGVKQIEESTEKRDYKLEAKAEAGVKQIEESTDKGVNKLEVKAEVGEKQIEDSTDKGVSKLEVKAEAGVKQIEESTDKGVNKLEVKAEVGEKQIEESTDKGVNKLEVKAEAGEKQIEESTDKGVKKLEVEAEAGVKQIEESTGKGVYKLEAKAEAGMTKISAKTDEALKKIEVSTTANKEENYNKFREGRPMAEGGETPSLLQRIIRMFTGPTYRKRKKELKDNLTTFYTKRYSTIPLSPLFEEHDTPLVDFYILPEMNYIEMQKTLPRGEEAKIPVKSLSDIFRSGSNCEIYLTADAGFGKTAFSKYLALTWCQAHSPKWKYKKYFAEDAINTMREFEFLFLVLLRDSSHDCNIDDLILNQIAQNWSRSPALTIDFLQEILHRERCLVILDGLDE